MDEMRIAALPVSIEPWGEGFHLDAEVSADWIDRIAKAGDVPADLRAGMASSLRGLLIEQASLWIDRKSPQRSAMTRMQLRDRLSAIRSKATRGKLPAVPQQLRLELRALEYRRRVGLPHGRLPPSIALTDVAKWTATFREVDEYIAACCRDAAALARLSADALDFLVICKETTQEAFARKSAFSPEKHIVFEWCFTFWTQDLAKPPEISKQLVAFTDSVCG